MENLAISDEDFRLAVDAKEESLEIEFKRELDLSSNVGKAKLAKEICALANHGGGWIVFGRKDDGNAVDELPAELSDLNQDTVNQVSASYLSPSPHCTVRWIENGQNGIKLPVVWVPSHGTEPICAAKNGPQDDKGKTIGIILGTYYVRTAGPVSAPIDSPALWKEVIRRCVLSDKSQLLGALSVMMSQPLVNKKIDKSILDQDFDFIIGEWMDRTKHIEMEPKPEANFIVFGFELLGSAEKSFISVDELQPALRSLPSRNLGPHHFFEAGYSGDASPFVIDSAGIDGLQADITRDRDGDFDQLPSLWRISEAGTGVNVVIFWEDTEWVKSAVESKSSRTWERGTNIWMASQIASIDSFLSDVWSFSNAIEFQGMVRIRISYRGLKGRRLNSPRSSFAFNRGYFSKQERREVDLTFQLDALEDSVRSSAVASIAQQLNKLFQGPPIDAESVIRTLQGYRSG